MGRCNRLVFRARLCRWFRLLFWSYGRETDGGWYDGIDYYLLKLITRNGSVLATKRWLHIPLSDR